LLAACRERVYAGARAKRSEAGGHRAVRAIVCVDAARFDRSSHVVEARLGS
jgi:hypothetical protein